MAEFMYGIRQSDGRTVSIYDIPNDQSGLKCNCKCPTCNIELEACSLQGKVNRYFRHYSDKGAGGGGGCGDASSANETALHLMAKEIIREEHKIFVPSQTISFLQAMLYDLPTHIKAKIPHPFEIQVAELLECLSVEVEKPLDGFQPDAAALTCRGEILLEVFVTNKVGERKKEKIKAYGAPTLEIDLSEFIEKPISRSELREILIAGTHLKEWVYYPIDSEALKAARLYYENIPEVKQYLQANEKKLRQKRLEAERKQQQERLEAEKRERRQKKLEALLEPSNYNAELVRLRNDKAFFYVANNEYIFFKDHKKVPWFIDIPITGEMIFQCDRRIWQGQIFDRYIYKRKQEGATFSVKNIFNNLKKDHEIPIDYDLTYKISVPGKDEDVWFRVEVIERYISYLELLGFVSPANADGKWYINYEWKIVNARQTIEPPDKEAANQLFSALKKVNRRSPDIDMLLDQELSNFHAERARQAAEARRKAALAQKEAEEAREREKKAEAEARAKKARETAEARAKKEREEKLKEIATFDFNQSEKWLWDGDCRLILCTSCNKIVKGPQMARLDIQNSNKCICRTCFSKQRGKRA